MLSGCIELCWKMCSLFLGMLKCLNWNQFHTLISLLGFKALNTARHTLRGYETMNIIRKRQRKDTDRENVMGQTPHHQNLRYSGQQRIHRQEDSFLDIFYTRDLNTSQQD
jgi:hypothetical protein